MPYQYKGYRIQGLQYELPVPSFYRLLGHRFCELPVGPRIGQISLANQTPKQPLRDATCRVQQRPSLFDPLVEHTIAPLVAEALKTLPRTTLCIPHTVADQTVGLLLDSGTADSVLSKTIVTTFGLKE